MNQLTSVESLVAAVALSTPTLSADRLLFMERWRLLQAAGWASTAVTEAMLRQDDESPRP